MYESHSNRVKIATIDKVPIIIEEINALINIKLKLIISVAMHKQGKIINIFWRYHHALCLEITELKTEFNNLIILKWFQHFFVLEEIILTIIITIKIKIK